MISRGAVNTIHVWPLSVLQNMIIFYRVSSRAFNDLVKLLKGASKSLKEVRSPVVHNAPPWVESVVATSTRCQSPL